MKMYKKLLACILAFVLCLSQLMFLPAEKLSALGIEASAAATSGACGENLIWDLNLLTGTLKISGYGDMSEIVPWSAHSSIIRKVVFDGEITSISDHAFFAFTKLESITIPDSVTYIGVEAFFGCKALTEVVIGKGVKEIGAYAFKECDNLICFTVDEENENYASFECALFKETDGKLTTLIQYPAGNAKTSYSIPDTVEEIFNFAFNKVKALRSISIPASVSTITPYSFVRCIGMESYSVAAENEKYISEDGVLFNKDKTELLKYPAGNKRKSYDIPDTVKTIELGAFENANYLLTVSIPDSVTKIKDSAFISMKNLEEIIIPDNVTAIGSNTFESCIRLKSVKLGKEVSTIGGDAFRNCVQLRSIKLPDTLTTVGYGAFYGCENLRTVTIPSSVTLIAEMAFKYCSGLRNIYYGGTEEQWKKIDIKGNNLELKIATVHYCDISEDKIIITSEEQTAYYKFRYTLNVNNDIIPEDADISWSKSADFPMEIQTSKDNKECKVRFLELGKITVSANAVDEDGNQIIINYNFNVKYTWWQWIIYVLLGFRFWI
ncbi:MAG: leucine-rich repeat domain-containing protein [Clostridia bacterium]|nr:leucine-rich repeat domain-containing protein [Clostridia bacterium]